MYIHIYIERERERNIGCYILYSYVLDSYVLYSHVLDIGRYVLYSYVSMPRRPPPPSAPAAVAPGERGRGEVGV